MKQVCVVLGAVLLCAGAARGFSPEPQSSGRASTEGETGSQLFKTHCASCHGVTGQGNGPLAELLRRPPADLTQIAVRNGGVFPALRVQRIIDGRDVEAHGNREMPVWGDAFKTSRDGFTEGSVKARIEAVTKYLESLQRRQA